MNKLTNKLQLNKYKKTDFYFSIQFENRFYCARQFCEYKIDERDNDGLHLIQKAFEIG